MRALRHGPDAPQLAELLVSAAAALAAPGSGEGAAALAVVGLPVRGGRVCLGRQREALGAGACDEVAVVAGFQTAVFLGCPAQPPPPLGRLSWRTTSGIDGRGRVVLDRRARTYLAVADPAAFEVVVLRPPGGGLLLVPTEGFEQRLEAVTS